MAKFKIGDRVICTHPKLHIELGDVGTVIDDSVYPFVNWDKFHEDNHNDVWGNNYWALDEDWLELQLHSDQNIKYEIY